ncbi:NAD(P)/FAD-dependent oxidoreductase [Flavobacterium sp. DG1-102-2]|uniref:FAD-dependent oxidoreductase n=1 Tax=Flavobacterium sp. DG1-102-2 TaxID=3081663 RepID=UPI00294A130C|nr:NAD(P)/FAD-dependent oxidoreductase [Flavobacterium sp. DG1-102-2]MDV6170370.1 NAD(P)/FAD-dependent oxidoreductase [Flavobacterium sp. DG1-102-2]
MKNENTNWIICKKCRGLGKKSKASGKKTGNTDAISRTIKRHFYTCTACSGSGLVSILTAPVPDTEIYPHVAIIGGGIGGIALAIACLHRGIPFTIYERDNDFDARSQGYGLTLQQAGKAIKALGILYLEDGVVSTKHIVHNVDGKVIGEWGVRKWKQTDEIKPPKHSNIHIARQSLRLALLKQLGQSGIVQWGHQLTNLKECEDKSFSLTFQVNNEIKNTKADLVVGADGIRSAVRRLVIGENATPLRYLDCIVILGICPLSAINNLENSLLDSATVFQTANGNERIYMMPYTADSVMWQLSFPLPEEEAKTLSANGAQALKDEACRRTQWHDPIPQILAATPVANISGYPVYDRELLTPELLKAGEQVTLIGDAAHPMSPFKGQGANQALLDALSLAREITKGCRPSSQWREKGLRECVLNEFESEMFERSAAKVKGSAEAAQVLHSENVLIESDSPRGRCRKS